jgi:hypothetical protein
MTTGTVKFYNAQKGFGFIQPDDGGKDVFVHATALERAGMRNEGLEQLPSGSGLLVFRERRLSAVRPRWGSARPW